MDGIPTAARWSPCLSLLVVGSKRTCHMPTSSCRFVAGGMCRWRRATWTCLACWGWHAWKRALPWLSSPPLSRWAGACGWWTWVAGLAAGTSVSALACVVQPRLVHHMGFPLALDTLLLTARHFPHLLPRWQCCAATHYIVWLPPRCWPTAATGGGRRRTTGERLLLFPPGPRVPVCCSAATYR